MKGKSHEGVRTVNRRAVKLGVKKRLSARVSFGFISPPFEGSGRLSQIGDESR